METEAKAHAHDTGSVNAVHIRAQDTNRKVNLIRKANSVEKNAIWAKTNTKDEDKTNKIDVPGYKAPKN